MKQLFYFILILVVLASCKKGPQGATGAQGPDGSAGQVSNGVIAGSIDQYDEFGVKLTTNLNTVTVSIKGTNLTGTTDSKGIYRISPVPAGVYALEFKGEKTQICRNTQVAFPGNGTMYVDASLFNKPTWTFSTLSVKDTVDSGVHRIKVSGTLANPTTATRPFLVLFSTNTNMNNTDPSTYDCSVAWNNLPCNIEYNMYFQNDLVSSCTPGYPSGTIFYAKVYPLSTTTYYIDAAAQEFIYYSVGDSPATTFTLTMP